MPNMRFVPVKTAPMQAVLAVHRARQGFERARTAQANQIRWLLAEFGIVIPKGIWHIPKRLPEILEDVENGLPGMMRELLQRLGEHLKDMDRQVGELERQIMLWHRDSEPSRKLEAIAGIGPILHLHPEELRRRAKAGTIPGAKVGRAWVFIPDDLVVYIRSLYAPPRQALQVTLRKEMECHFANAAVAGGSTSLLPTESEYAALLGLPTKP